MLYILAIVLTVYSPPLMLYENWPVLTHAPHTWLNIPFPSSLFVYYTVAGTRMQSVQMTGNVTNDYKNEG